MDSPELQRHRMTLRQSAKELADVLGVPEADVRSWELGQKRIPTSKARQIAWMAALAEREAVSASCSLPKCDWMENWERRFKAEDEDRGDEEWAAMLRHADDCSRCKARTRYVEEHCGPLPPPPGAWPLRAAGPLVDPIQRMSRWERRLFAVGAVIVMFGAARALRFLPWFEWFGVIVYLLAISIAATIGFTLYGTLSPFQRLGAIGRWASRSIAGVAAMIGFTATFLGSGYGSLLSRQGDAPTWSEGIFIAIAMGIGYAALYPVVSRRHE
jgi:hypothetical protein